MCNSDPSIKWRKIKKKRIREFEHEREIFFSYKNLENGYIK